MVSKRRRGARQQQRSSSRLRLVSRRWKWCNGWHDAAPIKEPAMSAVNEYLDKCLAECPEGAEEILLGEIAKRVLKKYSSLDRIEVHDRDGLVAYLTAAFIEIEDLPPDLREMALRETDPSEQGI